MPIVFVKPESISSIYWSKDKGWSVILVDRTAFHTEFAAIGQEEVYLTVKDVPDGALCEIVDTPAD